MLLAFASTSSMIMGVSSIMPMVPMLSKVFEVSLVHASLVITVFSLPGIIFAIFAGMLADRFGRKVVLAPSLLIFSLAGGACALAQDFETLLILRFIQGVGSAPLSLLNTTIIADTWSGPDLGRMVGYNMTVLSIGNALYPSIGGFLAHLDWRLPFLLPLLVLPVVLIALRTPLARPGGNMDFRAYSAGLVRTFDNRRVLALFLITFLTFTMLYGPIITCFPAVADARFHAGPGVIGLGMLFSAMGTGVMAVQLGGLSKRHSPRKLLVVSQCLYLVSLLLFALISHFSGPDMILAAGSEPLAPGAVSEADAALGAYGLYWLGLPIFLFGLGQGLNIPNVQTQLLQASGAAQRASIMAVNSMLQRIGQTVAPIGFSAVMVAVGLEAGFFVAILLALLVIFLAMAFLPKSDKSCS